MPVLARPRNRVRQPRVERVGRFDRRDQRHAGDRHGERTKRQEPHQILLRRDHEIRTLLSRETNDPLEVSS